MYVECESNEFLSNFMKQPFIKSTKEDVKLLCILKRYEKSLYFRFEKPGMPQTSQKTKITEFLKIN